MFISVSLLEFEIVTSVLSLARKPFISVKSIESFIRKAVNINGYVFLFVLNSKKNILLCSIMYMYENK